MFGIENSAMEEVVIDWEAWKAAEDGMLEHVKAVSHRISERVRNVLGEGTDEYVPICQGEPVASATSDSGR